jgi:hypothetical protein
LQTVTENMIRTGTLATFVAKSAVALFAPLDDAANGVLAMMKLGGFDSLTTELKAQLQAVMNYHVYPSKWDAKAAFAADDAAILNTRLADASALPAALRSTGCAVRWWQPS